MKKYFFSLLAVGCFIAGNGQNVGISANNPFVRLHIRGAGIANQLWLEDTVTTAIVQLISNRDFPSLQIPSLGTVSNHPFGIVTSNTYRMVIDTLGKIGVTTSKPVSLLSNTNLNILGSDSIGISPNSITWRTFSHGYAQALYNGDPTSGGNGLAVKIAGASAGSRLLDLSVSNSIGTSGFPIMVVQGNGKVGITTNNPGATLSLGATFPNQRAISIHDNYSGNNAYGIGIEPNPDASGSRMMIYSSAFNAQDAVAFGSYINTTFNEAMRVQANGLVGIGTMAPTSTLHIAGTAANLKVEDADDGTAIDLIAPGAGYRGGLGTAGAIDLPFFTNGLERMTVTANGLVGIATLTPNTLLANNNANTLGSDAFGLNFASINWAVNQQGYTQALYNASTDIGASGLEIKIAGTSAVNKILDLTTGAQGVVGTSVMVVRGDGNVGIGNASPSTRLHVNGTITATAPLNIVSDIRYKNNILPLTNAVNTVRQLKGVSYRLRRDEFPEMDFPSAIQIGFIAQEVEKVLPAIVATDKDGRKSISYTSVIPLLVEAVKEQQLQIDALKQLVEDLLKSKNSK